MKNLCEICKSSSAQVQVEVSSNGQRQVLNVCRDDLEKLKAQNRSHFSSFFENDPFRGFFGDESLMGDSINSQRESMDFDKYLSNHAKEIIQSAAQAAMEFGRNEIDTEHLLYALMGSDVVIQILKQFKVEVDDVKGYIDANAPKEDGKSVEREIGVSPRVKQVIQLALAVSQEMGHSYLGPEHLLVGLAEEDEGLAGNLLRKYGIKPESLRQKTIKVIGKGAKEGKIDDQSNTPKIDQYSRDLTVLAKQGKLDPVIGRAKEVSSMIEILARRTKNNPVLIGEAGVGKTAIVEGLAQRIIGGNVPEALKDKRVVELNINSLVAGSKFRGEFEERIKEVLDEITEHKDELVVFVDELHTIVGAGGAGPEGGADVAQVIKPALSRGDLHLIGATTLNEYQKYIEKDAALERRFQAVFVAEPTVSQAIEVLRGLRDKYEAHHKVSITDEAIVAAVELSDRYISNRYLPDKAIDLLDQAASRVRIGSELYTPELLELDEKIDDLKREKESAQVHKNEDEVKKIDAKLKKLINEKNDKREAWQKEKGVSSKKVFTEHIAEIVSSLTGIPVFELTQEEKEKLLNMEESLHERVIGQEEAIVAVSDAIRMSRAGLTDETKPIATLLFLGPTGVGKTELAKSLAWVVFGDEDAVTRIDMSEYMEKHAVARLIGAPPGYVGYEEGGQLTEVVRRRPYSVILLDEIEKAHPDVHNILLQLFDDGRLTDGKGRVIDFTNTIIISTSNVGSEIIQDNFKRDLVDRIPYEELKADLLDKLKDYFRPEFVNRLDEIIVFHSLSKGQIKEILGLQLEKVGKSAKGQGVELEFGSKLINYLVDVGYKPEFGARELKRLLRSKVEYGLAREMLSGKISTGSNVKVDYIKDKGVVFSVDSNST